MPLPKLLVLLKCLPFFGFAGIGIYMLCVVFFPSWRGPGWNHWRFYTGCDDKNPNSCGRGLGFIEPPKPAREGDWPEEKAIRFYLWVGLIMMLCAFIGIRHFAGVLQSVPDILENLPR